MANNRNELNKNLAQMLKGGVIMDVTTPEQAKIAQDAGACAVMALERIPADIRAAGGVSRMSDPGHDQGHPGSRVHPGHGEGAASVTLPKRRILQAIEIDYIDESEVLSPRRRRLSHRQDEIPGAVCLRREGPGRSAPPYRRGARP